MTRLLADFICADQSIDPALRRLFANPRDDVLARAEKKQAPRRFTGDPITGFDILDPTSERSREVGDEELAYQRQDEIEERNSRGD